MSLEALARVELSGPLPSVLEAVPRAPGVGQLFGPEGQSLLLATTSNLRRWAESNLGLLPTRPAKAARRPKTSLAGIAAAVAWVVTEGPFGQRLAYERLAARAVPRPPRPDLKPPAFLRLDAGERCPRVTVQGPAEPDACFGPFRDRRAAEKARDAVQRLFALRPCDFVFEPDPALPLGLACLYAQVRSCAAPCLVRVGEAEYRALAARAAAWLAAPSQRAAEPVAAVPAPVAAADGRAVIVDATKRGVSLYPVSAGRVLDAAVVATAAAELESALGRVAWPDAGGPSDWPWLTAWLRGARARAAFVPVEAAWSLAELHAAVRAALHAAFAAPAPGDNVGRTRGSA